MIEWLKIFAFMFVVMTTIFLLALLFTWAGTVSGILLGALFITVMPAVAATFVWLVNNSM